MAQDYSKLKRLTCSRCFQNVAGPRGTPCPQCEKGFSAPQDPKGIPLVVSFAEDRTQRVETLSSVDKKTGRLTRTIKKRTDHFKRKGSFLGIQYDVDVRGFGLSLPKLGYPFQPERKWGANRPWYWRIGEFSCGGKCKAEFPNAALRNAHDYWHHPRCRKVEDISYRTHLVKYVPEESAQQRFPKYLWMWLKGVVELLTYNIPRWHFTD